MEDAAAQICAPIKLIHSIGFNPVNHKNWLLLIFITAPSTASLAVKTFDYLRVATFSFQALPLGASGEDLVQSAPAGNPAKLIDLVV